MTAGPWLQVQVAYSHTRSKGGQEGVFCPICLSFCRKPFQISLLQVALGPNGYELAARKDGRVNISIF